MELNVSPELAKKEDAEGEEETEGVPEMKKLQDEVKPADFKIYFIISLSR